MLLIYNNDEFITAFIQIILMYVYRVVVVQLETRDPLDQKDLWFVPPLSLSLSLSLSRESATISVNNNSSFYIIYYIFHCKGEPGLQGPTGNAGAVGLKGRRGFPGARGPIGLAVRIHLLLNL